MATTRKRRRVVRGDKTFKARFQRFLTSFTPSGFKRYWLNEEGAKRAGKIVGFGALAMFLLFLYFAKDLPSPSKINAQIGSQTTRFYDRTGSTLLAELHGDKNRTIIGFNEMPDTLKHATVAIEDKDFYKHGAFSIFGLARAFTGIVFRDPSKGGGSTITQQYVKNALLTPEQTPTRKIKELILSIEIEQLYKKDDILKLYLNEIPYGNQAYGVKAAANTYFSYPEDTGTHKKGDPLDPKDLNLQQASMLAAIPQLPSYYSPYGNHVDALVARQHTVLARMVAQRYITQKDADAAALTVATVPTIINDRPRIRGNVTAPHFVDYVTEYLEGKYGTRAVETGGWKVITSLDMDKQKLAEQAIADNMKSIRGSGGSNAAMTVGDPKTGQILAMVGSYDYNDPNFGAYNVASANRQPGSSFKPFVYSTLFGKNKSGCVGANCATYGPGTVLYDVPTDFGGGYKPQNFGNASYGALTVRKALGGSLNIPAVKSLYLAGVSQSLATAHSMGITTLNQDPGSYGLSLVLGSGEVKLVDMVNAYEGFATGGIHHDSTPIAKIVDAKGSTFEDHTKASAGKKVLDPQVAYLINDILSDNPNRAFVFGNLLAIPGHRVSVKTGTTEHYNDAWTVGYTPSLTAGVWAGNNDNKPMNAAAAAISAPVWKEFMTNALKGTPAEDFSKPAGLKTVTLNKYTGKLPPPNDANIVSDLFPSWYKPENVAGNQSANVDKVTGKLATSCTPPSAVESRTAAVIQAEIPTTDPSYARWEPPVAALAAKLGLSGGGGLPTDSDDLHHCDDAKPSVNVTASNNPDGSISISSHVTSGRFPANNLTISFDDQVISTQSINGSASYDFDYDPTSNGSHTVKATVTDTALYSASDETNITVSQVGFGAPGPTQPSKNAVLNNNQQYLFSWSPGGGGPYTLIVTRQGGGPQVYNTGNTPSRLVTPNTVGLYDWYVQGSGGQSATRHFTVVP